MITNNELTARQLQDKFKELETSIAACNGDVNQIAAIRTQQVEFLLMLVNRLQALLSNQLAINDEQLKEMEQMNTTMQKLTPRL